MHIQIKTNWSVLFLFLGFFIFSCKNDAAQHKAASISGSQQAQLTRFEEEIKKFEVADKVHFPPKEAILFTGSSSIRMWKSLAGDMAPLPVINRGFGGSTIPEVIYYADRIVFPYEPKIIVFYCGENDIQEQTLPQIVFQNFKKFVGMVEERLPETKIVYLSMKPSLNRFEKWRVFQTGNRMIEKFAESREEVHYLDVSEIMLSENQKPDSTIFIPDGLHMNPKGYQRWTQLLKPVLLNLWEEEKNVE